MPETYNHYSAALRFMYKRVLKINWSEDELPRMKRNRSLPTILDKAEIDAILDVTTNLKYKAIFAVMYSGGLGKLGKSQLRMPLRIKNTHYLYR